MNTYIEKIRNLTRVLSRCWQQRTPVSCIAILVASVPSGLSWAGVEDRHVPTADQWRFNVSVGDRTLGTHSFSKLPTDSGGYEINSRADFEARVLFVKAFEYRHRSNEQYQHGCLQALESRTVTGGDRFQVAAEPAGPAQLRVTAIAGSDSGDAAQLLSGCLMSFAYWDKRILEQEALLNSQTGELVPVQIQPGEVALYNGVEAQAYDLVSAGTAAEPMTIRIWYAQSTGRWVGLESELENGRTLRYELALPDLASAGYGPTLYPMQSGTAQ
ncbi:MAG: DUF6134 family protein [Pseudomonadota bacterium]